MRIRVLLMFSLVTVAITSLAQNPAQEPMNDGGLIPRPPVYTAPREQQEVKLPEDLNAIVLREFGKDCAVATERSQLKVKYRTPQGGVPWTPFLTTDLNHDGVEDAVIVSRCKNAMARAEEFQYFVQDPYLSHHGYGDPKITQEFSSGDPEAGFVVLIVHGAGAEAWRNPGAKTKFALINLPFKNLSLTKVALAKKKKGLMAALHLEEGEEISSVVYWDGKKYKWRETGTLKP